MTFTTTDGERVWVNPREKTMIAEQLQDIEIIDGMAFDAETGEFLRFVQKPEFHVTDTASAEWLLEKASSLDADILALDARLKALAENLTAMKREKERQRDGLLYRFGKELEHVARENMPKGKKTWTCAYGSVAFRTTQPRLDVRDEDTALAWARSECPDAVKVKESLLKSLIPAEQTASLMCDPTKADALGFTVVPEGESVTVKTGVKP